MAHRAAWAYRPPDPPAGAEVRWPAPKCDYRVPTPVLVPDGEATRTQESHLSTLGGLGVHYDRFKHCPLGATPRSPSTPAGGGSTPTTCAPSVVCGSGWVSAPRKAPPHVGARTRSICGGGSRAPPWPWSWRDAGCGVPCGAPARLHTQRAPCVEPCCGMWSLGTCPLSVVHAAGNREGAEKEHGVYARGEKRARPLLP